MDASEAEIRTAFASLKKHCDPRGHELLDALHDMVLEFRGFEHGEPVAVGGRGRPALRLSDDVFFRGFDERHRN